MPQCFTSPEELRSRARKLRADARGRLDNLASLPPQAKAETKRAAELQLIDADKLDAEADKMAARQAREELKDEVIKTYRPSYPTPRPGTRPEWQGYVNFNTPIDIFGKTP